MRKVLISLSNFLTIAYSKMKIVKHETLKEKLANNSAHLTKLVLRWDKKQFPSFIHFIKG
jgi:hypothetical protein